MTIKQVSVFLENKTGRINEVTKTLSRHGINMQAFSMAETPDFGILRLIVSDVDISLRSCHLDNLVDDIVDTAGTICKAADVMFEAGAKSVRAIASHCVMSGPASERVDSSRLEEIVFTNSIPFDRQCAKLKQLSIAPIFAETIRRVMSNESISSQYII